MLIIAIKTNNGLKVSFDFISVIETVLNEICPIHLEYVIKLSELPFC